MQFPDLGHEAAGALRLRKTELNRLRFLEGYDFIHFLQHLDFAFYLSGFGVLGAKALDKLLHLLDAPGLVGGLRFQLGDALCL